MAVSVQFAAALLLISAVAILQSPAALSQTCESQTLPQNNFTFESCVDLPTLGASLHWTYDAAATPTPTLSVAFTAPPASPSGWVAWALNPTGEGMLGAQALAAFRDANGSVVVNTYNITTYAGIAESPISYGVLSKRAVYSGGVTTIFAVLALPETAGTVNQVWQVGADVLNGVPQRHAFGPQNLGSTSRLLLGSSAGVPSPSPDRTPSPTPTSTPAPDRAPSPTPTSTPTPDRAPSSTPTPTPDRAPSPATGSGPPPNAGSSVRGGLCLYGVLQLGIIVISLFMF